MASTAAYRQPLRVWRRYFSDFIQGPSAPGPVQSSIFFDFRVVHGDALLGERLRDHVLAQLADERGFLNFVVNQIVTNRPPIGFFGSFVVEKSGEHKDQLNLKARGINPLVDLVRFFAFEKGCRETGTLERIAALRETHATVREYADVLVQALDFLLLLRVHSQYRQESAGTPVPQCLHHAEPADQPRKAHDQGGLPVDLAGAGPGPRALQDRRTVAAAMWPFRRPRGATTGPGPAAPGRDALRRDRHRADGPR